MCIARLQKKYYCKLMDLYKIKKCTALMADSTTDQRNTLLLKIASALQSNADFLFEANRKDMDNAAGLSPAVLSRLKFDRAKLDTVIESVEQVASLPDPVGKVLMREELDDGLFLEKINVPIGVIGMIFEARPDALVQIASLCLKSGNCLVLKGGSEALNTNRALYKVIADVSKDSFLTSDWIELLETRDDVAQMLKAEGFIDLIIPRGSYDFVRYVMKNTTIPVLGHAEGLCSMYIDKEASLTKAVECALDAKTNAPGTCNTIENLLVHKDIAPKVLPMLSKAFEKAGVTVLGDERCHSIINCLPATEADWDTEYLELKISIKIVDSIEEAIVFISEHTSHHTDAIITEDEKAKKLFMTKVDSSSVFCNCSTRFADGFRYGLGAEVGISTSKIHARGPVGLEGLMTTKFLVSGNGHKTGDYMGKDAKQFIHRMLTTEGSSKILGGEK